MRAHTMDARNVKPREHGRRGINVLTNNICVQVRRLWSSHSSWQAFGAREAGWVTAGYVWQIQVELNPQWQVLNFHHRQDSEMTSVSDGTYGRKTDGFKFRFLLKNRILTHYDYGSNVLFSPPVSLLPHCRLGLTKTQVRGNLTDGDTL